MQRGGSNGTDTKYQQLSNLADLLENLSFWYVVLFMYQAILPPTPDSGRLSIKNYIRHFENLSMQSYQEPTETPCVCTFEKKIS